MEQSAEERVSLGAPSKTYAVLMEPDTQLRAHRALRRELCFSRFLILFLLAFLIAFFVFFFFQERHHCKDRERQDMTNGASEQSMQARIVEDNKSHLPSPIASLMVNCTNMKRSENEIGNITWKINSHFRPQFTSFKLDKDNEALIVPYTGTYRISIQVTYKDPEQYQCQDPINLRLELYVYTNAYPKPMRLQSVHDTISCKTKDWQKTMDLNEIFELSEGDRLRVQTNVKFIDCSAYPTEKTVLSVDALQLRQ